jgi:hypothetical protein
MPVDDTDPREAERPRGALTQSDREYLLHGEVGGSKSAESVKRHRIRERIRQSIFDLSLAFQEMSQEDASQVFDLPVGEKQQLEDSISDAFAFLYLGTGAHFQDSVQQALERAVDQYAHFTVDGIEVNIDVYEDEATSLDQAIEMLENPESIPEKTLKTMRVRVDEVPPDEQLQRLMNLDTALADALLGGLLPVSEPGSLPDTGEYIVVPGRLLKHTDQHPELPI